MSAPALDRRQARREAKLASILAEAWSLAERDGLAAISLRDLADAVGLRQPSLYVYFASKLDLYDAMFADGYRQMLKVVERSKYTGEPAGVLTKFVADCVQFASDNVVRYQLIFQRTIPGFEPSPESFEVALEFYAIATDLLKEAGVTAQADVDLFSALVAGLSDQQIANDPRGTRWVRLSAPVVQMFLTDVDRRRHIQTADGGRR